MLTALIFVLTAVTCAIWLTQALRFIDYIVNRACRCRRSSTWRCCCFRISSRWCCGGHLLRRGIHLNKMTMDSELV